jgi:Outer membrane protein beta-barrel domain
MPSCTRLPATLLFASITLAIATPCAAQGFGIGMRLSMMNSDEVIDSSDGSTRFTGGQVRLRGGSKVGFEVSLDRRSETLELVNEKVVDTPIQASLMLYPVKGSFSPYLLGGPGWYSHKIESLDAAGPESVSTRKFGWHAGFGAELLMGRHAGLHADYRYTFLNFGNDDVDVDRANADQNHSFVSSLLPSHNGSMWTAGFTIYF